MKIDLFVAQARGVGVVFFLDPWHTVYMSRLEKDFKKCEGSTKLYV